MSGVALPKPGELETESIPALENGSVAGQGGRLEVGDSADGGEVRGAPSSGGRGGAGSSGGGGGGNVEGSVSFNRP